MKIRIENFNGSALSALRAVGYGLRDQSADGEGNFVKRLGRGDYPRFHCYTKIEDGALLINLHIDQKRPGYEGTSRHAGEYDGPVVEEEAQRIKMGIR